MVQSWRLLSLERSLVKTIELAGSLPPSGVSQSSSSELVRKASMERTPGRLFPLFLRRPSTWLPGLFPRIDAEAGPSLSVSAARDGLSRWAQPVCCPDGSRQLQVAFWPLKRNSTEGPNLRGACGLWHFLSGNWGSVGFRSPDSLVPTPTPDAHPLARSPPPAT